MYIHRHRTPQSHTVPPYWHQVEPDCSQEPSIMMNTVTQGVKPHFSTTSYYCSFSCTTVTTPSPTPTTLTTAMTHGVMLSNPSLASVTLSSQFSVRQCAPLSHSTFLTVVYICFHKLLELFDCFVLPCFLCCCL